MDPTVHDALDHPAGPVPSVHKRWPVEVERSIVDPDPERLAISYRRWLFHFDGAGLASLEITQLAGYAGLGAFRFLLSAIWLNIKMARQSVANAH